MRNVNVKKVILIIIVMCITFIVPLLLVNSTGYSTFKLTSASIYSFQATKFADAIYKEDITDPGIALNFSDLKDYRVPRSYTESTFLVRFKIKPGEINKNKGQYMVTLSEPDIDYIDAFVPVENDGIVSYLSVLKGLQRNIKDPEISNNKWNIIIPENMSWNNYIYFKIRCSTAVKFSIENYDSSVSSAAVTNLYFGVFFGLLLAMIFYNLFIFFLLKDRNFLYYSFYIIIVLLYQARIYCYFPVFNRVTYNIFMNSLWFFASLSFIFACVFTIKYLKTERHLSIIDKLLKVLLAASLLAGVIGMSGWYKSAYTMVNYLSIICPVVFITAAAVRVRQGSGSAFYFLTGWLAPLAGILLKSFSVYMPEYIPTGYFIPAGTGAEVVFLSFAISNSFRNTLNEKDEIQKEEEKYRELSIKDPLTSLYNKRYFIDRLKKEEFTAFINNSVFSIIMMDIDDFKVVNDNFGHVEGDKVLIRLSDKIRECIRNTDIPCRYGGEEFAVILPDISSKEAFYIAERIRLRIGEKQDLFSRNKKIAITISIGIAEYNGKDSYEELIKRADAALYKAKANGKNCTEIL